MIRKGDIIQFKPEWQDAGDANIVFIATDDEDMGRVTVEAQVDLPFRPRQVVLVSMIDGKRQAPVAAGYIVADDNLIHGYGATLPLAWADMTRTMHAARIRLLDDDADATQEQGSWMRLTDLKIWAATADLLAQVESHGGACGWRMAGNLACTIAESEKEG